MKHYKFLLIIALFLFNHSLLQAQNSICYENSEGLFWPVNAGLKHHYYSVNDSYVSSFEGDSLEINGKFYLIQTKLFSSGKISKSYWREENGEVFNFNESKGYETVEFPQIQKKGIKWQDPEGIWKYEILNLNSTYSTPYCEFKDLLEVQAINSTQLDRVYKLYYKRGIGMVGLNINDQPNTFIIPPSTVKEKAFMAFGCENLESENEIRNCTNQKIFDHISKKFVAPSNIVKGTIFFQIIIDEKGKVDEVTVAEGLENATAQEKEGIRVLKSLPRFIPAQIDEGKPIRSTFRIPIKF